MNLFLFIIIVTAIWALESLGKQAIHLIKNWMEIRHQINVLRELHQITGDHDDMIAAMMLDQDLARDFSAKLSDRLAEEKIKLLEDKQHVSDAEEVA